MDPYSDEINIANYFLSRIRIEILIFLPVTAYVTYIAFLINIAKRNNDIFSNNAKKINLKSLKMKKRILLIMIFYFSYQLIFVLSNGKILNIADQFLFLFFQVVKLTACVLTSMLLKILTRKRVHLSIKKIFAYFWMILSFNCFLCIILEFVYSLFFNVLSFSLLGLCCSVFLSYLFLKNPTDIILTNTNDIYTELHTFPLIPNRESPIKETSKEEKFKNFRNKYFNPFLNKTIDSKNNKVTASSTFEVCEYNQRDSEGSNITKIANQTIYYPKIEVSFKEDYKYYQKNINSKNENLASFIFFKINIKIKEYKIDKIIKKNIQEFFDLESNLRKEFSIDKYPKKLSEQLPRLKIPTNNYKFEFFKKYTINFEIFLRSVVNEPCYILDSTLDFLEIKELDLSNLYNQARKKCINVNRLIDDSILVRKTKQRFDYEIRESINQIKSDYEDFKFLERKNSKNLDIKVFALDVYKIKNKNQEVDFEIIFRVVKNGNSKTITKKFTDLSKMISEASNYNLINRNLENIKNFSLKLTKDKLESVNRSVKIKLIENSVNSIICNYNLFKNNQIINEFLTEFLEDNIQNNNSNNNTNTNFFRAVSFQETSQNFFHFKILKEQNKIKSGFCDIPNYIFITIDFKLYIFYCTNLQFELKEGKTEKVSLNFKYKELKEYIELIKIRLKISNTKIEVKSYFDDLNKKIEYRKNELKEELNRLMHNNNFFDLEEWTEIFNFDKQYKRYLQVSNLNSPSPNQSSFQFTSCFDNSRSSNFNFFCTD